MLLSLPGANVPVSESSGSESFIYETFAAGSESTWERKFHNSVNWMEFIRAADLGALTRALTRHK